MSEIKKENDSRCKIYEQRNQGQFAARRYAIQHATGEYCMFLDIDDEFEKNTIETILSVTQDKRPDIVVFDGNRIINNVETPFWERFCDTEQIFEGKHKNIFLKQLLITKRFNNLCLKAVKRSICLNIVCINNLEKIRVEEDLLMQLSWVDNAKTILYLPVRLYRYFFNETSVTNNFVPNRYIAAEHVNKALLDYARKWKMDECVSEINKRYYVEVCESVRQLKIYKHTLKEKIVYISKIHKDKYFINKYDSEEVIANFKRKILLFCIRWNLWPIIALVI